MNEQFSQIVQRFLSDMGNVDASPEDYRDALGSAIEEIQVEIKASEETTG